ncbi:hypothetical protein ACWD11_03175 [Streptomyces sp. NPDC002776]
MGFLSWLGGGDDRELADASYSGRESATDRAARKRREGHRRSIGDAAAKGEAWEAKDRKRFGGGRR